MHGQRNIKSQQICILNHKFESIMDDIEAKDLWYRIVTDKHDTQPLDRNKNMDYTLRFLPNVKLPFVYTWLWRQGVYRKLLDTLFTTCFATPFPSGGMYWVLRGLSFATRQITGYQAVFILRTFVVFLWCYPTIWQFLCTKYWQADGCR